MRVLEITRVLKVMWDHKSAGGHVRSQERWRTENVLVVSKTFFDRKSNCAVLRAIEELGGAPQYKIYQNLCSWSIKNGFYTPWTLLVSNFASFCPRPRPTPGLVPPPRSYSRGFSTPTSGMFFALSPSSEGVRQCFIAKNKAENYTYEMSTFPGTFLQPWDAISSG